MNSQSKKIFNERLIQNTSEIRGLIEKVNKKRPLHLSSNLGIVEISLVVNRLLKSESNVVIYDIGHQSYTDKILTLGKKKFEKIRLGRGPSGFNEDGFLSGHSGNALSAGLGMSYGCSGIVTVVIGDAGFMNGQSLEAINNIFSTKQKIIIIINDNNMSISPTVGTYCNSQNNVFLNPTFLKSLSKNYIGIKNGNSVDEVVSAINEAKISVNSGPVIVHFKTKKGYGNNLAANDKVGKYHMLYSDDKNSFSRNAGEHILSLMGKNKKIVVVNPAMTLGTGCEEIEKKYKERYFDVGISEGHSMTFASGLKLGKKIPICFYYSTFLQRTFDQILNDCVCNKTNFVCLIDRADLASSDGQTHHGIHDVGFLKNIPNSVICSPRSVTQLRQLINLCLKTKKHCFVRYPRSSFCEKHFLPKKAKTNVGEWEYLVKKNGSNTCLVTYGPYIDVLARELAKINIDIINAAFITGYKKNTISSVIKKYENIIVYERTYGGHLVQDFYKNKNQNKIYEFNYQEIPKHGSTLDLDKQAKMNWDNVVKLAKTIC